MIGKSPPFWRGGYGYEDKNLKVADSGKAVEWKVWTVSDNQIAVQEGDINYNLLKR